VQADETQGRRPREDDGGAVTRDLWLVRDPLPSHEQDTERLDTLHVARPQPPRRFDWYGVDPGSPSESPVVNAEFQRCLRDISIRRAETQAAQEEENLRASREANRLAEEARGKDTRQRSRTSTVRLLRSIVLLVALTWTLTILGLTSTGVPVTKFAPTTFIRDTSNLIKSFETAIGLRHSRHLQAAATATPGRWASRNPTRHPPPLGTPVSAPV
jgi:hypothetical protein